MKSIYIFLLILIVNQSPAQSIQWIEAIHGNQIETVNDQTVDSHGNVLLVGSFTDSVDLDPGPGTILKIASGGSDMFVAKFNPSGNLIWAISLGGSGWDDAREIHTDGNDNVYFSGTFGNVIDIDPGPGVTMIDSLLGNSILVKLDSSGMFLWVRQSGVINNSIIDFDIKSNNHLLCLEHAFLKEIDENNNIVSNDSIGGNTLRVIIDDESNIFVSGFFSLSIDLDPDTGQYILTSHSGIGFYDVYVEKLDSSKNLLWGVSLGNPPPNAMLKDLTTDRSGNLIVAVDGNSGFCIGTNISDTCISAVGLQEPIPYLLKFNPSGHLIWSESIRDTTNNLFLAYGYCLATDQYSNIYFAGVYFNDSIDIDPGNGTFILTNQGSDNIFIQELDSNCSFINCLEYNSNSLAKPLNLTCNQSNDLYSSGDFVGQCNFDSSGSVLYNLNGLNDVYLVKHTSISLNIDARKIGTDLLQLFPNPSSGTIYIKCSEKLPITGELVVFDSYGKVVYQNQNCQISNGTAFRLQIENMISGVYTIVFSNGVLKSTKLFVKL